MIYNVDNRGMSLVDLSYREELENDDLMKNFKWFFVSTTVTKKKK